jgi:hypothetical protein
MATAKRAPKKPRRQSKPAARKDIHDNVWNSTEWAVKQGVLQRGPGRRGKVVPLFEAVGEKLPFSALTVIEKHMKASEISRTGVYIAHDSMGAARYIGRGGNVFGRLKSHKKAHALELLYFSFYIVKEKVHEREIETLLIRGASHLLEFNSKKKRVGIEPGNVRDYEPGTLFYERQYKKGKKASAKDRAT